MKTCRERFYENYGILQKQIYNNYGLIVDLKTSMETSTHLLNSALHSLPSWWSEAFCSSPLKWIFDFETFYFSTEASQGCGKLFWRHRSLFPFVSNQTEKVSASDFQRAKVTAGELLIL